MLLCYFLISSSFCIFCLSNPVTVGRTGRPPDGTVFQTTVAPPCSTVFGGISLGIDPHAKVRSMTLFFSFYLGCADGGFKLLTQGSWYQTQKKWRNTVTLECHLFVIEEAKNYNTLQLPGNIDECVLVSLLTGKHTESMGIHYWQKKGGVNWSCPLTSESHSPRTAWGWLPLG